MSSEIQKVLDAVVKLGYREDIAVEFIKLAVNKIEQKMGEKPVFKLTMSECSLLS